MLKVYTSLVFKATLGGDPRTDAFQQQIRRLCLTCAGAN